VDPVDTGKLFTNQVYSGVAPVLTPTAVKVVPVPVQTETVLGATVTLTGKRLFTVRLTMLDTPVLGDRQSEKVPPAVNFAKTASPFCGL